MVGYTHVNRRFFNCQSFATCSYLMGARVRGRQIKEMTLFVGPVHSSASGAGCAGGVAGSVWWCCSSCGGVVVWCLGVVVVWWCCSCCGGVVVWCLGVVVVWWCCSCVVVLY